jgi:CRP/FNR family transcriptional regulator, cyclic AMP receptor protein
MARQDAFISHLQQVPLFSACSKRDLQLVARRAEDVRVAAGKVLVNEGETGHEFFVILEGEIDVTAGGKHVATRGGGDFVGEIALLEETKRTATVTAKTPLHVMVLTRQDFRRLVDDNPSVERKIMHALGRRVIELSQDPTVA